jgi:hypothetical protein
VLESEVLAHDLLEDLDRDVHEGPATLADVRAHAARADVVVVVQVDIEDELALDGLEDLLLERQVLVGRGRVDRSQLDALRHARQHRARELVRVVEAEVADEDFVLEGEGELAVEEVVWFVARSCL